jgi:hypothetical protein
MIDQNEKDRILLLASSSASLDASPKHNWVEDAGGLPPYVRKLARGIMKSGGHDLSSAIAIAISRVKAWAAGGGDVNADTRAKAVKALAQWEKAKAKSAVKLTGPDGVDYIQLSNLTSFNTEIVSTAWEAIDRERRRLSPSSTQGEIEADYSWIRELGTDYIIVSKRDHKGEYKLRIPYTVNEDYDVTFGEPKKIIQIWVEDDDELTLNERLGLSNIPTAESAISNILSLSHSLQKK